jgi:predicted hotdog family 3-hydroxylacyl-ACP dehydratase
MVEEVVELRGDGAVCRGRIRADNPFVFRGSAPSFVALELAAQCAALIEALERRRRGEDAGPRMGYLVGVRRARFSEDRIPAERPLTVELQTQGVAPPLTRYEAQVTDGSTEYFTGAFSTFIDDSWT